MELSEKTWVTTHKVNGKCTGEYAYLSTEEAARQYAIERAYGFIDSLKRDYQGFAFKPQENSAEVYVGDKTYSWEWSEFPAEVAADELVKRVKI